MINFPACFAAHAKEWGDAEGSCSCDTSIGIGASKHYVQALSDSGDIWLSALWFVITSANSLGLENLLVLLHDESFRPVSTQGISSP